MGKLSGVDDFVTVPAARLEALSIEVLQAAGCDDETARAVGLHLVEASLKGMDSHGVMRLMQYVDQSTSGYLDPAGLPSFSRTPRGAYIVDGHAGFGIPAMTLAVAEGAAIARESGLVAIGVTHCGHTGRLGAYCEQGATEGCLTIAFGGGARRGWRQVAPHGGTKAMLPTNPYAFGIPGGDNGPVVLDFATSAGAGGWIYAAKIAGGRVPAGMLIDRNGQPTCEPDDYFDGGALLPAAGPKGYGLALMAELVGEAMLGPVTTEMNWIVLMIDVARYRAPGEFHAAAEEVLAELRACPPTAGFERVEIPGERERSIEAERRAKGIPLPARTWAEIRELAARLGVDA